MKWRAAIFILLFLALLAFIPPSARADPAGWGEVIPGIEYQKFLLPTPNHAFVARMDRSHADLTLESAIGQGRLSGGTERLTDMAARFDQAVNYWGQSWGGRNKVVVAINGSFFDFGTGIPVGGMVHSGWYAKRFTDLGGGSGLAWKLDPAGSFVGACVEHIPDKQFLTHLPPAGTRVNIDGINEPRNNNELVLYTPQYDATTLTSDNSKSIEVLVQLERPALILPENSQNTSVLGIIRAIHHDQGSTPIPFDHVVISARGTRHDELAALDMQIGDEIGLNQELKHYQADCGTANPDSWLKTYASISGFPVLLRNGVIPDFEAEGVTSWDVREPRTAIAFNDQYVFFIVIDGRNPGISVGMTYPELAQFARDTLGATWAINQDGGGSSTMVVNGQVVNNTYCNHVDCSDQPPPPPNASHKVYLPITRKTGALQRFVANGMLMIQVEPLEKSVAYSVDEQVMTTQDISVRLGPGTNYATLGIAPANAQGQILVHMNNLNGVLAKGSYWWPVSINGLEGWISEPFLIPFNWVSENRFERLERMPQLPK